MSRRTSISIYNYPEDLNPFNDDPTTTIKDTKNASSEGKRTVRETKNKFWTFGRSKKKQRSNSFFNKSTWSGLFGKRTNQQEVQIRQKTAAIGSSTHERGTYNGYPQRLVKDQQEFDEALGTLARRRKYTLDNSSRFSSNLTVNGDPGRVYESCPQDTMTSIIGDLTPKPPARRFGQMSPKLTDKLPPLNYQGKERTNYESAIHDEQSSNKTPVPPKRGELRSSKRSLAPASFNNDFTSLPTDVSLRDENENIPEDYVSKRMGRDAIRKSNLSINSCVSVGSTISAYGRKKRRAPQPPQNRKPLEISNEKDPHQLFLDRSSMDLQTFMPMNIAIVTENIDKMIKKSRELDDEVNNETKEMQNISSPDICNDVTKTISTISSQHPRNLKEDNKDVRSIATADEKCTHSSNKPSTEFEVELRRKSLEVQNMKILENARCYTSIENFPLARRKSFGNLSRSESFSVKEEIEKIERQIKILEAKNVSTTVSNEEINETQNNKKFVPRLSLQEIRKNFFSNMFDEDEVQIELRELPREQNDIRIIKIDDPPIPIDRILEPVTIIELHITEPIRQKPSVIVDCDVNPIPKPRRYSNVEMHVDASRYEVRQDKKCAEKKANSL